jgi:NADH-quinone oxidoreductase subunit C
MNSTIKLLREELTSSFDNIKITVSDERRFIFSCGKDAVNDVLKYLKSFGYDHLALISCVDRIKDNAFDIVYIISSYDTDNEKAGMNILVKTSLARDNPEIRTIIDIFENAEPYERELHELFGINFMGHPRLTQLFLEREYDIPPFRKDFDTRKYVKDIFEKVPFIEDKPKKR